MTLTELNNYTIIITADEPYSKMWHTQLIYTEYLSKYNSVIYINPPTKWTFSKIFKNKLPFKKVSKKLLVVDYLNRFPSSIKYFHQLNEYFNEKKISDLIKKDNIKQILIWHFDSFRNVFKNNLFNSQYNIKRIYHVIDPFYNNPEDRTLCDVADLIIVTSKRNNKWYEKYTNKLINVPQVIDVKLHEQLVNGISTIKTKFEKDYFVLLGTISDDIDFDWLLKLLTNINFKLTIIGKVTALTKIDDFQRIISHKNVDYLGLLSPVEFYPVLNNALAGMIIYNEERRAKVCSPLKTLNYIIAGLPVITNIDCEIPELIESVIYYSQTSSECSKLIEYRLNEQLEFNHAIVDEFLNKVSMSNAIEKIIKNI